MIFKNQHHLNEAITIHLKKKIITQPYWPTSSIGQLCFFQKFRPLIFYLLITHIGSCDRENALLLIRRLGSVNCDTELQICPGEKSWTKSLSEHGLVRRSLVFPFYARTWQGGNNEAYVCKIYWAPTKIILIRIPKNVNSAIIYLNEYTSQGSVQGHISYRKAPLGNRPSCAFIQIVP